MPQTQPGVSTGNGNSTSQPATQDRFVVRVEGAPTEFSNQTCAFAMNFVHQELLLLVEQSLNSPTREHVVIQNWIDSPNRVVTFEIVDSNNQIIDTLKFIDTIITDHTVDFNYANQHTAVHILSLSYAKMDLGAGKAQAAYASAMSIIGKP